MRKVGIRAFTLIELLTVIAIISLLAGILLPTLHYARQRARIALAESDISNLGLQATQYSADFGVYPPDKGDAYPLQDEAPASFTLDVPSEALVFFLGTQFKKTAGTNGDIGSIKPLQWTGSNKGIAYARVENNCGPYMEFKAGQLRNFDADSWGEFVDPWGYPYLYNAPGGYGGNPIHNKASIDIYSVGPNGKTRQASKTYDRDKDFDGQGVDQDVMGDTKDGNDVSNGNSYTSTYSEDDEDDINNW